ncbi:unnamed protein product [Urochloa decumbens]|uniref:Protein kinase domain-containing protein n=1 Tax=Urochloa decumbens TaxID=240449 RepID=A0ABC8W5Y8_9POAL
MADLVDIVKQIVEVGIKINDAVDTVRHNKEECVQIKEHVDRVRAVLSNLKDDESTGTNKSALSAALGALEDTLVRAYELVMICQETNIVSHFFTGGKLSKKLSQAKDGINQQTLLVVLATNTELRSMVSRIQKDARETEASDGRHSANDTRSEMNYGTEGIAPPGKASADTLSSLTKFSFSELEDATDNFADENIIARSKSTTVFKGKLRDGLMVTIKRVPGSLIETGVSEQDVLRQHSMVQHKHVVRLLGYCHEYTVRIVLHRDSYVHVSVEEWLLVEEYIANGSLEDVISGPQLDWSTRFRIILGVAEGLVYLHGGHILHLDLKPGNIRLDSVMNPKIGDFGISIARRLEISWATESSIKLVGTRFGIVLLETISGMSRSEPTRRQASLRWAWEARGLGVTKFNELFDPSLYDEPQLQEIERCMKIGLLCTQMKPMDRPTMVEVLAMLNGKDKLPTPGQPGIYER